MGGLVCPRRCPQWCPQGVLGGVLQQSTPPRSLIPFGVFCVLLSKFVKARQSSSRWVAPETAGERRRKPPPPLRQAVSKAYATAYAGAYATSADIYQIMSEFHTEMLTPSLRHKLTLQLTPRAYAKRAPKWLTPGRGFSTTLTWFLYEVMKR